MIRSRRSQGRFIRDRLPPSQTYFDSIGLKLHGRGSWRDALCPFHDDAKPSLRVNVERGGWRCMACGVHGGDVLAFHMRRYGLGFIQAAKVLGAWEAR